MPYVSRDASGFVSGIFLRSHPEAAEFLPGDHADIILFFGGVLPGNLENHALIDLTHSDIEFIRVIEDVIDVLIDKKLLTFTDLPDKVCEKILSRKDARDRLAGSNDLVVPDEWIL
jgi:hypothetical protein